MTGKSPAKLRFDFAAAMIFLLSGMCLAEFPKPSIYPISWELKFTHAKPQRIVVNIPGQSTPQAFWYMTYTVQNDGKEERMFLPDFQMVLEDGRSIRSDNNISPLVFDAIKQQTGDSLLQSSLKIAGTIRVGEDEAKDGVAIWPEPMPRLEHFTIFVQGLSGEAVTLQGPHNKPIILRKTLQLNYIFRGDEFYPGLTQVDQDSEEWVMR
ncbi:MAG TPA: hypothetical protein VGG19_05400 [Tepidisphaeraceae bacterium]|jgi:hypothetical protein